MADENKAQHDFTSKIKESNGDFTEVKLAIVKPSAADATEASKYYSKAWAEALKDGHPLRTQVPVLLLERGIWTEKDEEKLVELAEELQNKGAELDAGGFEFNDAKKLAEEMQVKRGAYVELAMRKGSLDNQTIEGQAELARLNYLIYACTVYSHNVKKKYFKSYEEFQSLAEDQVAADATKAYMTHVFGVDYDFEKTYPENAFLIEYGFMNDKLQPLNENGKPYDKKTGLLINDKWQWVDSENNLINIKGQKVDDKGKLLERQPFSNAPAPVR